MIEDHLVIDAVAHAYDWSPNNCADSCDPETFSNYGRYIHQKYHLPCESLEEGFQLSEREISSRWYPEDLAHAFFAESDVDCVIYHSVEIPARYKHGLSRWDTGVALKSLAPDRVFLYGCVDTFAADRQRAFDQMERMVGEGAVGFKFYPSSGFFDADRQVITMQYDDPERAFPFFDKARELGIKHLAFHKAQPMSGALRANQVEDLGGAAAAFPDLSFEVVHAGWAFLEQTCLLLRAYRNTYANLECVANYVVRAPLRFAHILGELLLHAGEDRILFATGCAINHPDPIVRKFLEFQIPEDLQEGYGYPELTPEIRAKILGGNAMRLLDFDPGDLKQRLVGDDWHKLRQAGKAAPWSSRRDRLRRGDLKPDEIGTGEP